MSKILFFDVRKIKTKLFSEKLSDEAAMDLLLDILIFRKSLEVSADCPESFQRMIELWLTIILCHFQSPSKANKGYTNYKQFITNYLFIFSPNQMYELYELSTYLLNLPSSKPHTASLKYIINLLLSKLEHRKLRPHKPKKISSK